MNNLEQHCRVYNSHFILALLPLTATKQLLCMFTGLKGQGMSNFPLILSFALHKVQGGGYYGARSPILWAGLIIY